MGHVTARLPAAAYMNRYVVVVDDDAAYLDAVHRKGKDTLRPGR